MLPEGRFRIARRIVDPRINKEGEGVEPRRPVRRPRPVHYDSPPVALDENVVGPKVNVREPVTAHGIRGGGGQGLQQGVVLCRPRVRSINWSGITRWRGLIFFRRLPTALTEMIADAPIDFNAQMFAFEGSSVGRI